MCRINWPRRVHILLWIFLCSWPVFAQREAVNTAAVSTAFLWRQALGGAVIGQPTVQAESVVVALDGGNIKAYSAAGRPLWDFSARGRLSPWVTRSREGTSYICRTNGIFIAVNRSGRELWRINTGGTLSGPVVIGWDGRVFIPAARKIICYTASGNLLWVRELEAEISAGPWLDQGGGILLTLKNGNAVRINHYGAAAAWRLPSAPRILLSLRTSSTNSVHAAGSAAALPIVALYSNGDVQLIDSSLPDAAPLALPRLPSPPLAAASREGNVAALLANGQLTLLSGIDGKTLWAADTRVRQENDAALVYDERGIYVLGKNGAAGFTADGKRLWVTTLTDASGIPAFDDAGILYSGGTDWILYAWKLEDIPLKQKRSLYGPDPEGSYRTGIAPFVSPGFSFGSYDEARVQWELENMNREIMAGRIGEHERNWIARLMDIAGGASSSNRPRTRISQRVLALQLLSRIGSSETIPWLARFFKTEDESILKAAAARAIGGIGVDPGGIALREFLAAAHAGDPVHDGQMLFSIAAATGALCRFSGPPLFDTGSRILIFLSSTGQSPLVQRQARHELDVLMGNSK